MGNLTRGKLASFDSVGQSLPRGNVMHQHYAAMAMMNPHPLDAAQLDPRQPPQNVLYVPSVGKQRQVRFLDRLGVDTFAYQY